MTTAAGQPGRTGGPIYLDYNATTPVDPRVLDAAMPFLSDHFGNPSTTTPYGEAAREGVAAARRQVADLLGCQADDVVFTSCGTESDTLAIRGAVLANPGRSDHVITQRTEHPAVLETCRALERLHGVTVTYLPTDEYGQVDPALLESAITPSTLLVSIMHANNETGTLQPIAQLAQIAHRHGALFHTDAAQSVGKIPTLVAELGVDLLTVAGHKLYAPKGIGALYIRPGVQLEPLLHGGGQEHARRGGTENVAWIAALGQAAAIALAELPTSQTRLQGLRDLLHRQLTDALGERVRLNGHPTDRLPNALNVSIDGTVGAEVLAAIPEIAAATGSACHAGAIEPSPVLVAMGLSPERASSALRLSLGRWTTTDDIHDAARILTTACR